MKAVILCGGKGSRIREVSEVIPKPMLPIGGIPIVWHIMKTYAAHGVTEFVLCLGYKGWAIKEYFLNYHAMASDFTISLNRPDQIEFHRPSKEASWKVTCANTGEDTLTGARLWRVRKYLEGDGEFCLTYGDGVADVDIGAVIEQHRKSGLVGTITSVKVTSRYGELDIDDGLVREFREKPIESAGVINGGYMVLDAKRIWDYLSDRSDLMIEREPMHNLAKDGQLGAYSHPGYWQCMDTPREYEMLQKAWNSGDAPWKIW